MNPTISIIVPVYNVEIYIKKCIDSILAQTFTNFELLLVNDGSTDTSGDICEEYALKDTRIKVIHKPNGGVSSARNKGIASARGKYIGFVDSDDFIEPTMYEVLYERATETQSDIVVCQIKTINYRTNTQKISSIWEEEIVEKKEIENRIFPAILSRKFYSLLPCYNKLYRSSLFNELNKRFDEQLHHGEDARLNLSLLEEIELLAFVKKPLYHYYIQNQNSLTQIFRDDFYEYLVRNKDYGIYLCKKYNSNSLIKEINSTYTMNTLNYMQNVVTSDISESKKHNLLYRIMNDVDFQNHIVNFESPTAFGKLLKQLCIQKKLKLFIQVVKGKEFVNNRILAKYS